MFTFLEREYYWTSINKPAAGLKFVFFKPGIMFLSISWAGYINFLLIAMLNYFPALGLLFYKKELALTIKKRGAKAMACPV